jgi:hypothetical protein
MSFFRILEILSFSKVNLVHKTSVREKFGIEIFTRDKIIDTQAQLNINVTSINLGILILDKLQLKTEFKNKSSNLNFIF